jgi:hypothetical protein
LNNSHEGECASKMLRRLDCDFETTSSFRLLLSSTMKKAIANF